MKKKMIFTKYEKSAFTLAEVLITLAIIGVVAALTIPSVVVNNRKQQYVAGFQKAYTTLNKAIQMSIAENGEVANWNYPASATDADQQAFGDKYIAPYLNFAKNCGVAKGQGCFKKGHMYKYLDNSNWSIVDNSNAYKIKLADGMGINFTYVAGCVENRAACAGIHVDVNGDKGPNQHGRDVFGFSLLPFTNQVVAHWSKKMPYVF